MTYLFKLSRRLSAGVLTAASCLLALACSDAQDRDFLSPNPGQPALNNIVTISVSPKAGSARPDEVIVFSATATTAAGKTTPADVDWSATGGTIAADGRFVADRVGQFRVTARLRAQPALGDSAVVSVYRSSRDVLLLQLSPDTAVITEGEYLKLQAEALLADGSVSRAEPLAWATDGGSVDGGGWFTAPTSGDYRVSATASSGVMAATTVKVKPTRRELSSLRISPDPASLELGTSLQFSAVGLFSDGTLGSQDVNWSSTGGTISSNGLYTAGATAGNFRVIARQKGGSLADTVFVTVREPSLVGLSIAPDTTVLAPDASTQFVATARYSNGSSASVGASWSSTGGSVTSGGLYTAPHTQGQYRVMATVSGTSFTDTAAVAVSQPAVTLTQVIVNPGSASVPVGQTRQFSATALYSDGSTRIPSVQWSATGGTISSGGLFTAGNDVGAGRVIAVETSTGKADTSDVNVTSPTLTQVVLNPSSVALAPGESRQFSVSGVWSDGSTAAPAVTWDATGGSITAAGLYSAGTVAGTFRVIARQSGGTLADTSFVTIADPAPTLVAMSLLPASVTVAPGGAQQFSVSAVWSNGATSQPALSWTATGGSVSTSGLYTAGSSQGAFTVIAREPQSGLADTSVVTVSASAPTLRSLAISPATTILQTGGSRQFTVTATWSDGSTAVPSLTWSATGGTVTNGGLYAAPATAGQYQVTARQTGGTVSVTAAVTVEAPVTLTSLRVSPDSAVLQPGQAQQFSVMATYSNGSTAMPTVTWAGTGGTVTSAGLYTAGSTGGTFRVVASASGVADTSAIRVNAPAPTLTGVTLTPSSVSMYTGGSQQFTATGRYSDGSTAPVTAGWSATGGTVTSGGLYTAGAQSGSFQVSGSFGGFVATAAVTLAVAPPPGSYAVVASRDWSAFADKSSLLAAGLIGPESAPLMTLAPALTIGQLFDLVPDPLFGKVVRFNGGTFANPTDVTMPPRVPVHVVQFADLTNVWVRQFVKFSPNWTTLGANPVGGSSYKAMFIRWRDVGFRTGWLINGSRDMIMEHGQAINGANFAATSTALPWDNHQAVSPTDGAYGVDAWPMMKVATLYGPPRLDGADGTGEWWEVVMHHKQISASTAQGTLMFRQYTVGGQPNPQSWKIIARETTFSTESWRPAISYQMGVNRNKWFDESMFIYWGPYEVVDGSRYPSPWGLPGQ